MVTKTVGPPSPDVPRPRDGVDVGPVGTETETLYGRVLGRVGDTAVTVGPAETSGGGVGRPLWGLAEGGGLGARGPVGHWTTVGAQRAVPHRHWSCPSVCLGRGGSGTRVRSPPLSVNTLSHHSRHEALGPPPLGPRAPHPTPPATNLSTLLTSGAPDRSTVRKVPGYSVPLRESGVVSPLSMDSVSDGGAGSLAGKARGRGPYVGLRLRG